MVFSSTTFLFYFLPLVIFLYLISPKKLKNFELFIFSLFFYAWGEPIYVLLMLFSTVSDYLHGMFIYKTDSEKKKKILLISSIIINLLILGFFKYSDFLINTINSIFNIGIPNLNLPLPIGISFYTFQTMSYSIDIYMKKAKPQKNIIDFGLFVTMFPQLIAGPIVKYNEISEELTERKPEYNEGVEKFILGLAKKVLLANNIGLLSTTLIQNGNSYFAAWMGVITYAFQIYFDFCGYSDMATGLGLIFGFHFPINFNYPYISKNITEFWRRWHISMGTWFREYVYIPLGGNKKGYKRQIINIAIVWLLTGIWHGAAWNFIIWGVYFGVILLIEKILFKGKIKSHIYSIILILIGWAIFMDESGTFTVLKSMFINSRLFDSFSVFEIVNNIVLIIVCCLFSTPLMNKIYNKIKHKGIILMALFIISIAFLVSSSYNPFLYFRF